MQFDNFVWIKIFKYLNIRDTNAIALVSKKFYQLANHRSVFISNYLEHYTRSLIDLVCDFLQDDRAKNKVLVQNTVRKYKQKLAKTFEAFSQHFDLRQDWCKLPIYEILPLLNDESLRKNSHYWQLFDYLYTKFIPTTKYNSTNEILKTIPSTKCVRKDEINSSWLFQNGISYATAPFKTTYRIIHQKQNFRTPYNISNLPDVIRNLPNSQFPLFVLVQTCKPKKILILPKIEDKALLNPNVN